MKKKIRPSSGEPKIKKNLCKSGKIYSVMFDAAPVGIGIADLDGDVLEANASMQEMIGYTLEELRKLCVADTYVDKSERMSLLSTLKKEGKVRDREILQKRKDGSIYPVLLNIDLIEIEGRKLLLTTARDITERKRADEELRAATVKAEEERNRSNAIIAAIGDGIMIQDKEYRILYENDIQKDSHGDYTGEYCYMAFEGRDTICEGCPVELTLKDGKIHRSEKRVVSDRGISYFEFTASPLRDVKGDIIAGIKVIRNVTERKKAEESLRISEERYRNLFETMAQGVVYQDATGKIISANPAAESILGLTLDKMLGRKSTDPGWKAIHEDGSDFPGEEHPSMVALSKGNEVKDVIMGIFNPEEANYRWINVHAVPQFRQGEKNPYLVYTTFDDITERKRVELALQTSEKKYSTIVEKGNDGIVIVQDGKLKFANQMMVKVTGLNLRETIGKTFTDFISPKYRDKAVKKYKDRLAGKELSNKYEIELISKDGKDIPVEINASLIEYEGKPAVMAIIRDITERKNLEEKLREGERFLESIFSSIQDGIGIIDKNMNILKVNKTARTWYPHVSTFEGRKCYEAYRGRSEPCVVCPSLHTLKTGESAHEVVPKSGPDGTETGWLEIYSFPMFDTRTGDMTGAIEYVRDITERKRMDEALQKSILQQKAILNNIPDLAWLKDKKSRFIAVNEPFAESCGVSSTDMVGKTDLDIWPRELAERYRADDIDVMARGRRKQVEEPLINKDGERSWIETIKTPIYNDKGEVIGTTGIARDITERKRVEESLKLFSEAVEEAPDGVQIVDLNGYITYSNRAVEEMYGIPAEELKGKHVNEMNMDPEFAGRVIIPSIKETERWVGELMVKHKSGHEFPIWLTTSMVKDMGGRPIAMVGIIRDITERRRIEKALKESEERYRSLFENSPISLWEEDSSRVKKYIDDLRNKGIEDFRAYFESHPEEVDLCATMVRIINVNQATLSLFKAGSKDELLKDLSRIFTEHSYDLFREELVAIAESRTAFEGEDFVKTVTGDVKQIYLKWSVAPGFERTYSRRHVSIMDITERKRIEDAIKKYAGKLEESNRMKELFIDIMHHDLMNPIATASGFIELLKDDEIYKKDYIETIDRNLDRAMDLIECATKFSRIESLEHIEYGDIDLKEVIDGVIENLRPLADKVGMKIENNISASMPVKANKIIEEIFMNLISNAIKYAPQGKRIIVNGEDRDPFWNVKVIDFGEGLKDIDKTMIFDRFCRIEKKGVKGSGLGLAIAKKIIELHRGGIGIEDNPEGGAVFIIEIPKLKYLDQIH